MEKTIKVTGKAKLSLKPDVVYINMSISNVLKDYAELINESNKQVNELKDLFVEAGFKREDLKTTSFNINTHYESYKEKDVYKQRFKGYAYNQELKLEVANDNKLLAKAINAILSSNVNPEFNFVFSVKDQDSARNELLAKAVEDSRIKAEIMASAGNVKIKGLQSMDYSWSEINIMSEPNYDMCMNKCVCENSISSFDIEAEDINISDTVTVYYEIE